MAVCTKAPQDYTLEAKRTHIHITRARPWAPITFNQFILCSSGIFLTETDSVPVKTFMLIDRFVMGEIDLKCIQLTLLLTVTIERVNLY